MMNILETLRLPRDDLCLVAIGSICGAIFGVPLGIIGGTYLGYYIYKVDQQTEPPHNLWNYIKKNISRLKTKDE